MTNIKFREDEIALIKSSLQTEMEIISNQQRPNFELLGRLYVILNKIENPVVTGPTP